MKSALVAMAGKNFELQGLSNFEAGLAFLSEMNRLKPGITFRDLERMAENPEQMNGWLTNIGKGIMKTTRSAGTVLKDTFDYTGTKAGELVRLATSPQVADSVSRAGAAYATGGKSEAVRSLVAPGGSKPQMESTNPIMEFISTLGFNVKKDDAKTEKSNVPLYLAGGAAALVLVMVLKK